ncbi:glycosyltransferase family 8 protein [Acidisoma silvae]|uniref:Glycosyltransferase family 8 protein n=1 Tax=Acidisoma silvae TaxID=2802396 RepID=A0A963YSN0_9PROT|nr:glycosyltransferase [Acidisoma silvae]MCB8876292.1 hypothetical protein [Acidisoma silvae]
MKVCFVYVTDERGFDLTTLSALSLGLSQSRPDVHILGHKFLPQASKEFKEAAAKLDMRVTFGSVEDAAAERHETFDHITTPSLLKLAAVTSLVSDYDRIVYIDYDFLVFKKLDIEGLNFDGRPIAAVADLDLNYINGVKKLDWRDQSSLSASLGTYFNSGFMIFDAATWRVDFLRQYQAALDAHALSCDYVVDCTTPDQCALNKVFSDNWRELPADYNMQAAGKFTKSWQTAATRHYCGARKFLPLSPLRSDYRDTGHINAIHDLLGRPTSRLALAYWVLFKLNCIRKYRASEPVRHIFSALTLRLGADRRSEINPVKTPEPIQLGDVLSSIPVLGDVSALEKQA